MAFIRPVMPRLWTGTAAAVLASGGLASASRLPLAGTPGHVARPDLLRLQRRIEFPALAQQAPNIRPQRVGYALQTPVLNKFAPATAAGLSSALYTGQALAAAIGYKPQAQQPLLADTDTTVIKTAGLAALDESLGIIATVSPSRAPTAQSTAASQAFTRAALLQAPAIAAPADRVMSNIVARTKQTGQTAALTPAEMFTLGRQVEAASRSTSSQKIASGLQALAFLKASDSSKSAKNVAEKYMLAEAVKELVLQTAQALVNSKIEALLTLQAFVEEQANKSSANKQALVNAFAELGLRTEASVILSRSTSNTISTRERAQLISLIQNEVLSRRGNARLNSAVQLATAQAINIPAVRMALDPRQVNGHGGREGLGANATTASSGAGNLAVTAKTNTNNQGGGGQGGQDSQQYQQ